MCPWSSHEYSNNWWTLYSLLVFVHSSYRFNDNYQPLFLVSWAKASPHQNQVCISISPSGKAWWALRDLPRFLMVSFKKSPKVVDTKKVDVTIYTPSRKPGKSSSNTLTGWGNKWSFPRCTSTKQLSVQNSPPSNIKNQTSPLSWEDIFQQNWRFPASFLGGWATYRQAAKDRADCWYGARASHLIETSTGTSGANGTDCGRLVLWILWQLGC